jgi:hypothetical protein
MGVNREPDYTAEDRQDLRRANRRLKKAQADYERFVSAKPITGVEAPLHSGKEMREAQEELQAAEAEVRRVYTEHLRRDPAFKSKSDQAERVLSEGPPWEDSFSPSEVSMSRDDEEQ